MFLPYLDPARHRELKRFTVEVSPVAKSLESVLVDLIAGNDPQNEPGSVSWFQDCFVDRAEKLCGYKRLAAAGGNLDAECRQVLVAFVPVRAIHTGQME